VEQRGPAERAARLVRVAVPAAPEHEPGPGVVGDLGVLRQELLRLAAAVVRRGVDEAVHGIGHAPIVVPGRTRATRPSKGSRKEALPPSCDLGELRYSRPW